MSKHVLTLKHLKHLFTQLTESKQSEKCQRECLGSGTSRCHFARRCLGDVMSRSMWHPCDFDASVEFKGKWYQVPWGSCHFEKCNLIAIWGHLTQIALYYTAFSFALRRSARNRFVLWWHMSTHMTKLQCRRSVGAIKFWAIASNQSEYLALHGPRRPRGLAPKISHWRVTQ